MVLGPRVPSVSQHPTSAMSNRASPVAPLPPALFIEVQGTKPMQSDALWEIVGTLVLIVAGCTLMITASRLLSILCKLMIFHKWAS